MPNLSYTEITETCELVAFEEDSIGSTIELWADDINTYRCLWLPKVTTNRFPTTIYKL